MAQTHTPQQVAATIKDIIKTQYGTVTAFADKINITPAQVYALLSGKEYLSVFASVRFATELDLNMDYCTKGELPVMSPQHDYNVLLGAATDFFYAVRDEDKLREEYEKTEGELSSEQRTHYRMALEHLRIAKAKAGCALVDLLNIGWAEENPADDIEKPQVPRSSMKLHEAVQYVIRQAGHPLTFTQIAQAINKDTLYTRKDGNPVPASQISARIKNYPDLFKVDSSASPVTIDIH